MSGMTKAQRRYQEQLRRDWRELLQDPRFCRVIWSILDRGGIYSAAFAGNSQDIFRQGQRNAALAIVGDMIAAKPTAYAEMLLSAAKEHEQETLQNDRSSDDE